MGKKIGIKLADGTFYPIMDDGVPQKKLMELTTAQDNQSIASIDLYRSESGTMEDAEYVDTLELSELPPHPGGMATISFTVQLDENNMLSAEVVDSESGKTSATKSDLINLPPEKRNGSADSTVSTGEYDGLLVPDVPADDSGQEMVEALVQDEPGDAGVADFDLHELDLDDFSSVDSLPSVSGSGDSAYMPEDSLPAFEDDSPEESEAVSEIPAGIDDLPDFGDVSLDFGDEGEGSSNGEPVLGLDSLDLDDFSTVGSIQDEERDGDEADSDASHTLPSSGARTETLGLEAESLAASDHLDSSHPDDSHLDALLGKDETVMDATTFDLPDFGDGDFGGEGTASKLDATSFDLPDFEDSGFSGEDATSFDLPDFEDTAQSGGILSEDSSFDIHDFGSGDDDFTPTNQDSTVYEDSLPDFSKFELPDFDDPVKNDFSFGEESGLFNENDFKDPAFYTGDTASAASPFDFSGLYDDRENELKQQENRRKQGGISVAVCVVCALICVGILLFILFLLPSKFSNESVATVDSHTVTVSQQEMEAHPDSAAAVEDVIVIVETPSVVPAPPSQVAKKTDVVRYKVKWGDTLWDIAQSYYNNPWLYKRIVSANNIKNPDHIVAGTILIIPHQ